MVQKNKKWIYCILPLSLVVVFWLYEINLIAYADSSQFRPPQSQMQSTKRYEESRALNVGVIEKVKFLNSPAQTVTAPKPATNTASTEKKKETPAWLTILGAVGLLGASQALKKENPVPVAPKQEFKIMKIPRIITANITEMIDKTVEVIKKVPYTAYETMQRTVDKVVDVTKKVAETVYETVNEKVITPVKETYDKAVEKTKQVTEYVTTKVEEAYKYATQVTKNVTETVMQSVREAYDVVKQVPRQVTEYITTKVNQTKQVARTVYDNVKKTAVWVENKVSTVWDEVKETKTRVVEKFENVSHWVGDKYRTITEKFWGKTGDRVSYQDVPVYGWVAETSTNWIKKGWNWLKSTTTKWVNKIVSWTKKKIIEPVYGWVTRSYQQLVEAGHWVTDRVKRLVNETYTEIKRIPRTITEKIKHVSEWVEKVPRTVYDTVTEVISKTIPVVKTVYDTVKETAFRIVEKPVQIVKQVAETVWNTGTRLVDKIVPVVKDVAYTAYEKAERFVDKVVEVVKQVPKTIYKEITEKVITPVVETYEVAVEKLKDVKEYITVKTPTIKEITRTVYDDVKVPVVSIVNTVTAPIQVGAGMVVGAVTNVIDTVVGLGSLGISYVKYPEETKAALVEYGKSVWDNPGDAAKDLATGYKDDVSSQYDDGGMFNAGKVVGFVALDVIGGKGIGGIAKSISKEVGEKALKEITEKVSIEVGQKVSERITTEIPQRIEKTVIEAGEKAAKEAATKKLTQVATEKSIKEAMEKAAKEEAEKILKEAKEIAIKETEKLIAQNVGDTSKRVSEKLGLVPDKAVTQPVNDLDEIYELSKNAKSGYDKALKDLASETRGKAVTADLKSKTRAIEKVDEYVLKGGGPENLKDVLRGSVRYNNIDDLKKGLEETSKKFEVVEIRDRMSKPLDSGYRDIQLFVKNKNGSIAEVQLHIGEMLDAKALETPIHNAYRDLEKLLDNTKDSAMQKKIREQMDELNTKSRKIYEKAWEDYLLRTTDLSI